LFLFLVTFKDFNTPITEDKIVIFPNFQDWSAQGVCFRCQRKRNELRDEF
jgi:hypothetical protein